MTSAAEKADPSSVGTCALLLAVGLIPFVYDRTAHEPYTVSKDAVAGVLVPLSLAFAAFRRSVSGGFVPRAVVFGVAGLFAAVFASTAAIAPAAAWEALRPWFLIAAPGFVLGYLALGSDRALSAFGEVLGAVGVLAAVIGLMQAYGLDGYGFRAADSVDWTRFGPAASHLRSAYESLAAFDPAASITAFLPEPWRETLAEVLPTRLFSSLPRGEGPSASVFGHANLASEIVAAGAAASVMRLRSDLRSGSVFRRVVRLPVALLRATGLVLSALYLHAAAARGPVLALAAVFGAATACFVLGAPSGLRRRRALAVFVVACVAAGAFFAVDRPGAVRGAGPAESLFDRLGSLFRSDVGDPSRDTVAERLTLWANTGAMIRSGSGLEDLRHSPLLGIGPGQWEIRYPESLSAVRTHATGTFTIRRRPDFAHQDPLQWFAETGFAGLLAGALLAGAGLAAVWRGVRSGFPERRDAVFAAAAPAAVLILASFVSFPFGTPVPLLWTFAALGGLLSPREREAVASPSRFERLAIGAGLAAGLVAGVAAMAGAGLGAVFGAALGVLLLGIGGGKGPGRTISAVSVFVLGALGGAYWLYRSGGDFDRLTFAVAVVAAVLALVFRGDANFRAGPGGFRATAFVCVVLAVVGALGGRARMASSTAFRAGGERVTAASVDVSQRPVHARAASDLLDAAVARSPAAFLAEQRRAEAYAALGRFDRAESSALRAVKLDPGLANPHLLLGNIAFAAGRFEDARRFAVETLRRCAGSPEARTLAGRALAARGDAAGAIVEFERAVVEAPAGWAPFAKIGAAELRLKTGDDPARALVWLEQAANEASLDPVLLESAARLFEHPTLPPLARAKAGAVWRKAAALDSTRPLPRLRVAVLPLLSESSATPAEARLIAKTLEGYLDSTPADLQAEARFWRAVALERAGDLGPAESGYRDAALAATRLTPADPIDDVVIEEALSAADRIRAAREAAGATSRPDAATSRPGDGR